MRTKQANFFACKVKYQKVYDDGYERGTSENYVIDALSFAEAEVRITEEMSAYVRGEFEVKTITPCNFGEVVYSEDSNADKWYKVKVQFITIDEKTEKEKRTNTNYLVQALSLNGAVKNIDEFMHSSMVDYNIALVQETNISEVFEYTPKEQLSEDESTND